MLLRAIVYCLFSLLFCFFSFFFNDTATTEIYTLSLHDALPIFRNRSSQQLAWYEDSHPVDCLVPALAGHVRKCVSMTDRKSTRLNSSHSSISYAVFCLKKKKKK